MTPGANDIESPALIAGFIVVSAGPFPVGCVVPLIHCLGDLGSSSVRRPPAGAGPSKFSTRCNTKVLPGCGAVAHQTMLLSPTIGRAKEKLVPLVTSAQSLRDLAWHTPPGCASHRMGGGFPWATEWCGLLSGKAWHKRSEVHEPGTWCAWQLLGAVPFLGLWSEAGDRWRKISVQVVFSIWHCPLSTATTKLALQKQPMILLPRDP